MKLDNCPIGIKSAHGTSCSLYHWVLADLSVLLHM